MNSPFDTPWKIINALNLWFSFPLVRLLFLVNRIPWGKGWRFFGIPILQKHRKSTMTFGEGLNLRSALRSNPLGPNHPVFLTTWDKGSVLSIGNHFAMTGGSICAAERIVIGNHVAIGANTTIVDTDFHPLDFASRLQNSSGGTTAPVHIEDHVFIGMNCLILKGVVIGSRSVIGAGSVVTKSIPPDVIAAGNPARIIRTVKENDDSKISAHL